MQKPAISISIILATLALIGYNIYLNKNQSSAVVSKTTTVSESNSEEATESLLGGQYELTDKNGKPVKSDQFLGKKQIIYFGFTNCPMICPTAVNNISILMNELGDLANSYTPIFISVDPKNDTPERLTDYFANMHKSFVPLTGTEEQIEKAKKAFRVYAEKTNNGDDINHSSIIYILDENGNYLTHFSHETPVDTMVEKLKSYEK